METEKEELECKSVNDFLNVISNVDEDELSSYFRGHANKKFELQPSIYRKDEWYSNEDKIVREIIMRCPSDFSHMQTNFEKLVKMQHYDLPTRLLDITENPLVALYFSCSSLEEKGEDGEVVFFKIPQKEIKYFDSDTVSVISALAWAKNDFEINFQHKKNSIEFYKENKHANRLMHIIKQEKSYFLEKINPDHLQSVLCVKPKLDNPRVIRQEGAFLLFGIDNNKHHAQKVPSTWLGSPQQKRIIIKSKYKEDILNQLSKIGISKDKLFPEIDKVSEFIKNEYGLTANEFESTQSDKRPGVSPRWG
ncbi:FRG domain-containing protein [Pseudocolwellia agarivorans]|uniref:FRG domain-containing protein n=1 Tax=Pseudocolwellia agarivorans TaxID=1911682 RepID=UPI000986D044|nr:FRG domain-containing protein [Pseudocolwellia agarivorans]